MLRLDLTRRTAAVRRRLSAPGLYAFSYVAEGWALDEVEKQGALGLTGRASDHAWTRAVAACGRLTLSTDALARISAVLGIHKALRVLFTTDAEGAAWLRRPNAALPFNGHAPLALITDGTPDGVLRVRRFLDAAQGGLHMAPNGADSLSPWRDEDIVIL
ncbi:MbcA/ParS/Xre antitoxin family protein [Leptolyngbya sp. 15MV]|nr:MbcA/ParS/Xre antitoxin family protein [Leptolyngbya sp. 15MV]